MAARVQRLEEDTRESRQRRETLLKENGEEHRRLWNSYTALLREVTALQIKIDERQAQILEKFEDQERGLTQLRDSVESRFTQRVQGGLRQRLAYIAGGAVLLAALLQAVAQVVTALTS